MKTIEDFKRQVEKLPKPQKKALEAMTEAFRMAKELNDNFGFFILVVGHKDMLNERPVNYISNMRNEEAHAVMLEYAAKRIRAKLKKTNGPQK